MQGVDITSKVGTKISELKCNHENYLMAFGKKSNNLSHRNAEQYLVKAIDGNIAFYKM